MGGHSHPSSQPRDSTAWLLASLLGELMLTGAWTPCLVPQLPGVLWLHLTPDVVEQVASRDLPSRPEFLCCAVLLRNESPPVLPANPTFPSHQPSGSLPVTSHNDMGGFTEPSRGLLLKQQKSTASFLPTSSHRFESRCCPLEPCKHQQVGGFRFLLSEMGTIMVSPSRLLQRTSKLAHVQG